MPTRRDILKLGVASAAAALAGCVRLKELQPNCPVDFAPSLLAPVFYGFQDIAEPAMRVYFPSLDGSPQNAAILQMCERFPLVIFVHGDCGGDPIGQWIHIPAQLARSGYVVAVTRFGGVLADGAPATTAPLRDVHDFMRNAWQFRDRVLPAPKTAIVGHSFGGTLGAQLVTEIPVSAFVSVSGTFGQMPNPAAAVQAIQVPALYLWNDTDDPGLGAVMFNPNQPPSTQLWTKARAPKHGVVFEGGNHGDYMLANSAPRCAQQGACAGRVRAIAADYVTAFVSKYLSPEYAFAAFTWVPDEIFVRPQDLPAPPLNGFYAGGFLQGFGSSHLVDAHPSRGCVETVMWETASSSGTRFVAAA
jgi:pimeloyl-ACP methyl ester carboxylesterase